MRKLFLTLFMLVGLVGVAVAQDAPAERKIPVLSMERVSATCGLSRVYRFGAADDLLDRQGDWRVNLNGAYGFKSCAAVAQFSKVLDRDEFEAKVGISLRLMSGGKFKFLGGN